MGEMTPRFYNDADVRAMVSRRLAAVERPLTKQGRPRAGTYGLRAWCREQGVASSHASEFMNGKRGPHRDLLSALGLEYRIVDAALAEEPRPCG